MRFFNLPRPIVVIAMIASTVTATALRADSMFMIGNSITDTINYEGFKALAESRGKTQPLGRHMIPGAPLELIWDNPANGFQTAPYGHYPNALPNFAWDVLSLQPFDRLLDSDVTAMKNYLGLLFGAASPTVQQTSNRGTSRVLIYARWPRQDEATRAGGIRSYDALWLRTYTGGWDNSNESSDYFATITTQMRSETVSGVSLADRVFMVPVGHVLYDLNQRMKAGQVPGYTNIFELYADGIHLNNVGAYLVALTYFTTIYKESPIGLTVPAQYEPRANTPTDDPLSPTFAALLQEIVWDTVRAQPLSGVASSSVLTLTTAAVPTARTGQVYSTSLQATGGTSPRSFAVTAGTLPSGVALSSAGQFSGTPAAAGTFDFTVTVTDSASPAASVSRAYRIVVEANSVPVITTAATLPPARRVSRYGQSLAAQSGNGTLTWELVSGALPTGLQLASNGVLVGAPLVEGTFAFTARVSDQDNPPDTAQRAFTLQVDAPAPETLFLSRTESPVRIDGSITETHWDLAHSAERAGLGTPDNTVRFQALWDAQALYVAIRVLDATLTPGAGTGVDRDSVDIFIDAFNDKEAEFNQQHRQLRVGLDGGIFERGGRLSGVTSAVMAIPGGYTIECRIPWTNLSVTPVAGTTVIGIDVGVNDRDEGAARQHFQRFAFADAHQSSPAQFGQALLTSTTVNGTGGEPLVAEMNAIATESFDYAAGALHGGNGGAGWGGSWVVQNDDTVQPGFSIATTAELAAGAGAYASGGRVYLTAGRMLGLSGDSAFGPVKTTNNGQNYVGGAGRTVWLSVLIRKDANVNDTVALRLHGGNIPHNVSTPSVELGFFSGAGVVDGQRRFGVLYRDQLGSDVVRNSSTAVTVGQAALLVARIDFGGDGAAGRVRLYVNPTPGSTPPAADVDYADLSASFLWRSIAFSPGNSSGQGSIDEIKVGLDWTDVVSGGVQTVAPVTFSPAPGRYSDPVNITLQSATSGTVIRYTVDGTAPTESSPIYSAPLVISQTTTVRAMAFGLGASVSPISGATFTRASSPFSAWWQQQGMPGSPDPVATGADGTPLLVKFALGARAPGDPVAVPDLVADEESGRLTLVFRRAREDFTYTVEGSSDLLAWDELAVNPGAVGEDVVVEDPVTPVPVRRFLRLRVTPAHSS